MKLSKITAATAASLVFAVCSLAGQESNAPGVPTNIVVTLEPKHGKTIPPVEVADISVKQQKDKRPVTGLDSLANADTQLLLLIDDSARGTFDTEINTLKRFIGSLPPNLRRGRRLHAERNNSVHAKLYTRSRLGRERYPGSFRTGWR